MCRVTDWDSVTAFIFNVTLLIILMSQTALQSSFGFRIPDRPKALHRYKTIVNKTFQLRSYIFIYIYIYLYSKRLSKQLTINVILSQNEVKLTSELQH